AVARSPGVKFFVSSLDVPAQMLKSLKEAGPERRIEHHWHERVRALGDRYPNVYVFELKALVESVGRQGFYSRKRWYLAGMKYSVLAENPPPREIGRCPDALAGTGRKKCLVLDLDDTLWGGIIGEDGLQGIQLGEPGEGARYKDFQRRIRQLKDLGVILAVVSKNNDADVREVFEAHPHMVLKEQDFASFKVNWSPKPQNIVEVAEDLAIGLDSLVYIDDNPVEREAVRAALPEVAVPDFPADTCELSAFLEGVHRDYFLSLDSTAEDRIRTETYLQNARRAAERNAASSIEEFLSRLKTRIRIWRVTDEDVPRAAQLTQKTNQLNFTTRRYTEQELQAIRSAADSFVYIASVADVY